MTPKIPLVLVVFAILFTAICESGSGPQSSSVPGVRAANTASTTTLKNGDATDRTLVDMDLFVAGEGGYSCYRLPNLVQLATPGHILAVAQGHKYDCSDGGRLDVVARRTEDNGRTWTSMQLVYTESEPRASVASATNWNETVNVTLGTPSLVYDKATDVVFLFACRNFQSVLLLNSTDGGQSWSETPRDLTSELVAPDWTAVFTGLPQGIQLRSGRLLVCVNHGLHDGTTKSNTFFSDDHGTTWQVGKSVGPEHMGECSLAEVDIGTSFHSTSNNNTNNLHSQAPTGVFMYARVWWDDSGSAPTAHNSTRALTFSSDGGETFAPGNTSAFPGNPSTDNQGAMISAKVRCKPNRSNTSRNGDAVTNACNENGTATMLVVGSPWGVNHFPRQNYSLLYSYVLSTPNRGATAAENNGLAPQLSAWKQMASADPLFAGPSEYSSLLWPTQDSSTFFVCYERGGTGTAALRFTQLRFPDQ